MSTVGRRKKAVELPLSLRPFGPGEWTLASVQRHGLPRRMSELVVALTQGPIMVRLWYSAPVSDGATVWE